MKNIHQKIFKTILFFTSFLTASVFAEEITLDRVAAVVDDGVVMESELNNQLQAIKARMSGQDTQLPPDDVLKSQVLEHLISQELQMQMARRAGVTIDDREVNQAIAEMQRRNGVNEQQFLMQLQMEGLTLDALRNDITKELMINRVQRGVLGGRLNVTEHDVDSFLNSQEGQFWTAPEYHVGHILIAVPSDASDAQVAQLRQKAELLHQQIEQGADFARMATTYSAGQNALQGGDLGWRKPAQLPELFASQIENLTIGGVTKPFKSGAGFHLLTIHDQRGGGQQIIQQTKVRHILVQPSVILTDGEAKQLLTDVRQKIIDGADFADMAKEHSKDPGSALQGGDLGWAVPGQFVPQFEQTMNETPINEISEPFRSQHGWHILQVTDRRQEDMSETVIKNQAFNLLRNRRFEEELPIWLQEIRDEAYVDIKLADLAGIGDEEAVN